MEVLDRQWHPVRIACLVCPDRIPVDTSLFPMEDITDEMVAPQKVYDQIQAAVNDFGPLYDPVGVLTPFLQQY